MGASKPAARCFKTSARFSPACLRPVKYSPIRYPSPMDTIPLVNTPVRSAARSASLAASRSSDSTRMEVSVVVHHFPLRRRADQLIHRGLDLSGGFLYDLALCCPLEEGCPGS